MKLRKNISIIMAGLLMSFVSFSSIRVSAAEPEVNNSFKLDVKNVTDEEGKPYNHLEWTDLGKGYTYRVFQNGEKNSIYQSIPTEKSVKTLNIYPDIEIPNTGLSSGQKDLDGNDVPDSGILKTWLLKENIDDVTIDCVSLTAFNTNPEKYLKKEDGKWNYNSVFYGMWNLRQKHGHPNDKAIEYLRGYINEGGGFMTSHHTIGYIELDTGVNKLAKEMGVEIFSTRPYSYSPLYAGTDASGKLFDTVSFEELEGNKWDCSPYWVSGNMVKIVKNGLLMNYPFEVGKVGKIIKIPDTHGLGVFGKGDVWMNVDNPTGCGYPEFNEINQSPATGEKGTNNFYVHTYNNTAIINSGHSFPDISEDETKIIANTLYYLSQITEKTNCDAHIGQDTTAPEMPKANVKLDKVNNKVNITLDPTKDIGTDYSYYVEATEKGTNNKIKSTEQKTTVTSGLKGYSIVVDDKAGTVPKNEVNLYSNECTVDNNFDGDFYVHVAAIDNADNISKVYNYHYSYPTLTLTKGEVEDNTVKIKAEAECEQRGIEKIVLPDNTEVKSDTCEYTVKANGTYTFSVVDTDGNKVTKSIKVTDLKTDISLDLNDEGDHAVLNWSVADNTQKYTYNVYSKKSGDTEYKVTSVEDTSYDAVDDRDVSAPSKVKIDKVDVDNESNLITVKYNGTDDDSTSYDYYVEAVSTETGIKSTSQVRTAKLMSGIKGYSVIIDKSPDTVPDKNITTTGTEYFMNNYYDGTFYVHVSAVDKNDNVSEVSNYIYSYPTLKLTPNTTDKVRGSVTIKAEAESVDNGIASIKTPDGKLVEADSTEFTVNHNGVYTFTATDTEGHETTASIEINNILSPIVLDVESNVNDTYKNSDFAVDLTIDNIKDIYAAELIIKYDSSKLSFLGFEKVDGIEVVKSSEKDGKLTLMLMSLGKQNPMTAKTVLLKMNFRAIQSGKAAIDVDRGTVAGVCMQTELLAEECGHTVVNIYDREFTLLDLAVIGNHLGEDPKELLKQGIDIDINHDGKIDKEDYDKCSELILKNPSHDYDFEN